MITKPHVLEGASKAIGNGTVQLSEMQRMTKTKQKKDPRFFFEN